MNDQLLYITSFYIVIYHVSHINVFDWMCWKQINKGNNMDTTVYMLTVHLAINKGWTYNTIQADLPQHCSQPNQIYTTTIHYLPKHVNFIKPCVASESFAISLFKLLHHFLFFAFSQCSFRLSDDEGFLRWQIPHHSVDRHVSLSVSESGISYAY